MIYDVAIIGAGPCGLAVASRLRESTPSALFTDDEHARYWRRFSRLETIESERKRRRRPKGGDGQANSAGPGSQGSGSSPATADGSSDSKTWSSSGDEEDDDEKSIIVLDAKSNEWMSAWKEKFRNLQISELRSPLFFHPDPRDRDGLLAFSHFNQRTRELQEIQNVVGREISKHHAKKSRRSRSCSPSPHPRPVTPVLSPLVLFPA